MRKSFPTLAALAIGVSLLVGGCTTEQRGGRTTGQYIDDKTLNAKVRSALNGDSEYRFPDVKVETFQDTVQLNGFVTTSAQKQRAEQIARGVRGVRTVENKISVQESVR